MENNTHAVDVIFCRNVLMYFTPQIIEKVTQNLMHSLTKGGWLILGAAECSIPGEEKFERTLLDGATLYQKSLPESPVTPAPPAPAPKRIPPASPAPGDPERLYEAALSAFQSGRNTEAAATLQILIKTKRRHGPLMGNVFALMARIEANRGNIDLATKWAEQSISADKLNPTSHYLLATILEENHHLKEARQALKRALYLDPNFIMAHFSLGHITKPIDPKELCNALDQWLKAPAPPAQKATPPRTDPPSKETISIKTGLITAGEDTALYNKLLRKFNENHADSADKIKAALHSQKNKEATLIAHTIKGVAGTIGAEKLYIAAEQLNSALINDEPSEILLEQFEESLALTVDTITNLLTDPQSPLNGKNQSPADDYHA
ncbi:CheR family methyltransferase [Verrucomicrobiota bacterium]